MPLVEVRKEIAFRIRSKSFLQLAHNAEGHLKLLFLEYKSLLLFIDHLDGLLYLVVKVEDESFKSELNICDFFEPKINKILIISLADLLIVGMHLGVEKGGEVALEILAL
jgi:hypothetical protein